MKSRLISLLASLALVAVPMNLSSCSSGADSEEVSTEGGVTVSEFASGTVAYSIFTAASFTLRPIASANRVDDDATYIAGVDGYLEIGEESIPVFFSYETTGDLATTGPLTGTVDISLNGVQHSENANLMRALGAPADGRFISATIEINYLAQTMTIESRVMQFVTFDPDALGTGDIITGVEQPQTSYLDSVRFFFTE